MLLIFVHVLTIITFKILPMSQLCNSVFGFKLHKSGILEPLFRQWCVRGHKVWHSFFSHKTILKMTFFLVSGVSQYSGSCSFCSKFPFLLLKHFAEEKNWTKNPGTFSRQWKAFSFGLFEIRDSASLSVVVVEHCGQRLLIWPLMSVEGRQS